MMERASSRLRLSTISRHLSAPSQRFASQLKNLSASKKVLGMPVIIGAMVLDIHAVPFAADLQRGTTVPGKVTYVQGGVGRNVAECITKLGVPAFLISVVGQDMAGQLLVAHWLSLGLSIEGVQQCAECVTPVVSAVFDTKGELATAVADVTALEEHMTPKWICQFVDIIQSAPVMMVDANLMPNVLEAACSLAREANVPIWFEPVSVPKSVRATGLLKYITFASPNKAELISMAENLTCSVKGMMSQGSLSTKTGSARVKEIVWKLRHHIYVLLATGMKYIVLTLGKHGVVLCSTRNNPMFQDSLGQMDLSSDADGGTTFDAIPVAAILSRAIASSLTETSSDGISSNVTNTQTNIFEFPNDSYEPPHVQNAVQSEPKVMCVHLPALPSTVVSLSGAGDCLVAGTMAALSGNCDLVRSLAYGVAVARLAVQSDSNVPECFSRNSISDDVQFVMSQTQVFHI
ncbi:hypothetical protein O6H91_22G043000 [Diphasiastrum complanatum]|uniref:Uncharacterized protein n=2 Tax=Diphasiastrum complanatum TaxID=34168 RepID=A0ACC2AGS1_DIPCM|nr:hypothetical protein O6H91_22G043000 [Diphasiastrum complanatum]